MDNDHSDPPLADHHARQLMTEEWKRVSREHAQLVRDTEYFSPEIADRLRVVLSQVPHAMAVARAREAKYRQTVRRIFGWTMIINGILVTLFGTTYVFELQGGNWTRPVLGLLAIAAGSVLSIGNYCSEKNRTGWQAVGLAMSGFWYFVIGMGYVIAMYVFLTADPPSGGHLTLTLPWNLTNIGPIQPRIYGISIMLSQALILWYPHLQAIFDERRGEA